MYGAGVTHGERDRSKAGSTPTGQDVYPNYAFLVHSQSSLMQDLPPKVDTAMTARQKRRRTSPEDHAILEAAYQKNSKPDKSDRIEIVQRVSLSEKEVQIWFQNRRQNDRRKSRPLLPHEMVPHFRNSVPQVLLNSVLPGNLAPTESHRAPRPTSEVLSSTSADELERRSSRASSIHDLLNLPPSIESPATSMDPLAAEKDGLEAGQSPTWDAKVQTGGGGDVTASAQDSNSPHGGVKRSHDEMTEQDKHGKGVALAHAPSLPSHCSHVRLSMSLDGAVKVKTNDEETPSPPKQRAAAPTLAPGSAAGLQRSQSAIVLGLPLSEESAGKSKGKGIGGQFGRSRDARTWEFYCDGDVREALSAHAENERVGSAVGAINLIRSQSQKSRLQVMAERSGNATAGNPPVSARGVKPKLSRAKSSMGRLQDTDQSCAKRSAEEGKPWPQRSPSGDSDKENWAPGTRSSRHPLSQQHTSTNRQPLLGDADYRPNPVRGAGGPTTGATRGGVVRPPVAVDRGILDRSDQCKTLIDGGKGEDLDCIQGLLSLSQGAWR